MIDGPILPEAEVRAIGGAAQHLAASDKSQVFMPSVVALASSHEALRGLQRAQADAMMKAAWGPPVGVHEIAGRLDTTRKTIDTWRERYGPGHHSPFPAPRWKVGNRPAWDWPEVEAWAIATHRLDPTPGEAATDA